jgi:hypothetical protein
MNTDELGKIVVAPFLICVYLCSSVVSISFISFFSAFSASLCFTGLPNGPRSAMLKHGSGGRSITEKKGMKTSFSGSASVKG